MHVAAPRVAGRNTPCCTLQHGVLRARCAQCAAPCMLCAARCNAARCISLTARTVCCRRDVRRPRPRAPLHACSAAVVACNGDADGRSGCAFPFLAACAAAAWTCTPPSVRRAAPQCRLPLHARVWSAPRCAVDRFSVGTYTFTCATNCAAATCSISKTSGNIGGTLPDVFDRLTCASKITSMCAPPLPALHPDRPPICVLARRGYIPVYITYHVYINMIQYT